MVHVKIVLTIRYRIKKFIDALNLYVIIDKLLKRMENVRHVMITKLQIRIHKYVFELVVLKGKLF